MPPGDSQTNTVTVESGTPTVPANPTAGESSAALVSTAADVVTGRLDESQIGSVTSRTNILALWASRVAAATELITTSTQESLQAPIISGESSVALAVGAGTVKAETDPPPIVPATISCWTATGLDTATSSSAGQLQAVDPRAVDRIDLLTVVEHELGHIIGLEDLNALTDDLMGDVVDIGVHRDPSHQDAVDAALAS